MFALAAAIAGCAGSNPSALPSLPLPSPSPSTTPTPTPTPSPSPAPAAVAVACAGQTTTATNASVTETLVTAGGSACLPLFGGFGGTIVYPTVSTSVTATLTASTTNDASFPTLGSGAAIYYLQIALSGATTFGAAAPSGGGLVATSTAIVPGAVYSILGQATFAGNTINLTPCQTTAASGANGAGVISGLGTVLNGAQAPAPVTTILEIVTGGTNGAGPC